MAQIDTSIPMGFRPIQIESPVNQMAALSQLQNAQQQQQMNALKMQEYQRGTEQRNALARIHADPNVEVGSEGYLKRVAAEAPDLFEGVASRAIQRETLEAQREERVQRKEEREQKLNKEQLDTAISDIASFNTLDDIQADIQRKVIEGKLKTEYADRIISGLPTTDAEVPAWQMRTLRSLLSAKDRLTEQREQTRVSNEEKRLELEDARIRETQRHQQAMEAISTRGADRAQLQLEETQRHNQAMEKLRLREINKPSAAPAPTVTMVLDPSDNTRMLSVDAKTYRGGSLGSTGVIGIAGKEPTVGKKQEAKETAQKNAETTIAKLRQSYERLDELGGITSTENRIGTNLSARMGASPVGQTVGSFFGTKTQSERDKIEQTRPLLMTTIMQAMGLSAKQLDSNAELKLWLSSATDPTKSLEANREALDNLERMLTGENTGAPATPNLRKAAPPPPSGFVPDKK